MIKNYSNFNLKKYRLKEYESLSSRQYNTPIKANFDLFNKRLKENLSFYNSPQNLDNEKMNRTKFFMNKSKIKIERYEKDLINLIKNENHNTRNKNNYFNQSDNSDNTNLSIYTPVDQYLYKNPLHSLTILKINNTIRSNINKLCKKRQELVFNKSIQDITNTTRRNLINLSKIKISPLLPINLNNKQKSFSEILSFEQNSLRNIFKFRYNKNSLAHLYSRLNASFQYCGKNFPQSREQFTLISNGKNIIYLIGGICCVNECNEIWKYDLNSLTWEKIKSNNLTKSRHGHSAILKNDFSKIYIYGGVSKFDIWKNNITKGGEENFGNLEVFDLDKKEWFCPTKSKFHPTYRKNHTCELIGNDLVIMLGISKENEVLNDAHVINISCPYLSNERWEEVFISRDCIRPRLYGHTSALVIDDEILYKKKCSIYHIPNEYKQKSKDKIKNVGIYIFGGKNKFVGGSLSNDIYLFHIGQTPCWWEKIENVKGIKPSPRYLHSMSYYKPGNFLIIHGGKNIYSLNDTFLFDLTNYQWSKILLTGIEQDSILPRNGHQSVICGNQLIIFGGVNNGNYIGSSMFVINLIPNASNVFFVNTLDKENKNKEQNDNKKSIKYNKSDDNINLPKIK